MPRSVGRKFQKDRKDQRDDHRIENAVFHRFSDARCVSLTVIVRSDGDDRIAQSEAGEQAHLLNFIVDAERTLQEFRIFFGRSQNQIHSQHHHGKQTLYQNRRQTDPIDFL